MVRACGGDRGVWFLAADCVADTRNRDATFRSSVGVSGNGGGVRGERSGCIHTAGQFRPWKRRGLMRQIGAIVIGLFVFWAVVSAMSRLLTVKEIPGYIDNLTRGLSNLFKGAFGQ